MYNNYSKKDDYYYVDALEDENLTVHTNSPSSMCESLLARHVAALSVGHTLTDTATQHNIDRIGKHTDHFSHSHRS